MIKKLFRKIFGFLRSGEDIRESKIKWNKFAEQNPLYYIYTEYGEKISEEQFKSSGEKDYRRFIEDDEALKDYMRDSKSMRVLEIGCGAGRITEFFAQKFSEVYGIDISEKMTDTAKKRLAACKNVNLIATDGINYPFADGFFDFVFSFIVFQHIPDKSAVQANINEVSRVIKNGGIAKIQLRGLPAPRSSWYYGPHFTFQELKKMAERANLKIIKTEGEGSKYFWVWFQK